MSEYASFDWDGTTLTYKTKITQELIQDLKSIPGIDSDKELREIIFKEFQEEFDKWVAEEWKKND